MKDDEHEIARVHMGFPEVGEFGELMQIVLYWGLFMRRLINWGMARTGVVKRKRSLFQPRVVFQQHKSLFYITFLDWRYRF